MSFFDDFGTFIKDAGAFAKGVIADAADVYKDIQGFGGQPQTTTAPAQQQTQPAHTYDPNITWGDFAFTPNWYLLGGGAVLLIVVLVLLRK